MAADPGRVRALLYDPETDSLHAGLHDRPVARTDIHEDEDLAVAYDEEGDPVSYTVRFASRHPDLLVEVLRHIRASHFASEGLDAVYERLVRLAALNPKPPRKPVE